jgi:hypothetical protein
MPDENTIETLQSNSGQAPSTGSGQAENNEPITTEPLGNPVEPETGEQIVKEPGAESAPEVLPSEPEPEVLPVEPAPVPTAPETILPTGQDIPRDPSSPRPSGALQDDKVANEAPQDDSKITEAGIMARLKAMLMDKLRAAWQKKQEKIAASLEMIMAYAREQGKVTNDEVEKLVKVKDRQALRYLTMLCKQGRLVRFGTKKNTFYKAVN